MTIPKDTDIVWPMSDNRRNGRIYQHPSPDLTPADRELIAANTAGPGDIDARLDAQDRRAEHIQQTEGSLPGPWRGYVANRAAKKRAEQG